MSSLSLNGATLQFDLSNSTAAGNDKLAIGGALSLAGTTTVAIGDLNDAVANGVYTLATYGSLSQGSVANLTLASTGFLSTRQTAALSASSGSLFLTITGNPQTLVWSGTGASPSWNLVQSNTQWINGQGGQRDYFATDDNVTFNDANTGSFNVSIADAVAPGSLNVSTSNVYTFTGSGSITGLTGLTKSGSGKLVLANSGGNDYSGGTNLQGGTIVLGGNNVLPTAGTVTFGAVGGAGALDLGGYNQQLAGLTVASGALAAGQIVGNSSTTANSTLTINGTSTFGGAIQDAVSGGTQKVALDVAGGLLSLTGTNTFSGGITVNGGTLQLANAAASPSGTGKGNLALNGALDLDGVNSSVNGLSGSGTVATSVAGSAALTVGLANASSTFAGTIQNGSGVVSLTKAGRRSHAARQQQLQRTDGDPGRDPGRCHLHGIVAGKLHRAWCGGRQRHARLGRVQPGRRRPLRRTRRDGRRPDRGQ